MRFHSKKCNWVYLQPNSFHQNAFDGKNLRTNLIMKMQYWKKFFLLETKRLPTTNIDGLSRKGSLIDICQTSYDNQAIFCLPTSVKLPLM